MTFKRSSRNGSNKLAIAGCTDAQIVAITGHAMRDVQSIPDAHYYLHRDPALAEEAIRKLEVRTNSVAEIAVMSMTVKSATKGAPTEADAPANETSGGEVCYHRQPQTRRPLCHQQRQTRWRRPQAHPRGPQTQRTVSIGE